MSKSSAKRDIRNENGLLASVVITVKASGEGTIVVSDEISKLVSTPFMFAIADADEVLPEVIEGLPEILREHNPDHAYSPFNSRQDRVQVVIDGLRELDLVNKPYGIEAEPVFG